MESTVLCCSRLFSVFDVSWGEFFDADDSGEMASSTSFTPTANFLNFSRSLASLIPCNGSFGFFTGIGLASGFEGFRAGVGVEVGFLGRRGGSPL